MSNMCVKFRGPNISVFNCSDKMGLIIIHEHLLDPKPGLNVHAGKPVDNHDNA